MASDSSSTAAAAAGSKRKLGEDKENLISKRVRSLDGEMEDDGYLARYPPVDQCNVTIETPEGWKIMCHKADLFRIPGREGLQVFRVLLEESKTPDTIHLPVGHFPSKESFVAFFDMLHDLE